MKFAIALLLFTFAVLLLGYCLAVTAKPYPVKEPYSVQKPIPVFQDQAKDIQNNSSDATITIPCGDICSKNQPSIAIHQVLLRSGIETAYATIYDTVRTASDIPATNQSSIIEVVFFTGSATLDTKSDSYKVLS